MNGILLAMIMAVAVPALSTAPTVETPVETVGSDENAGTVAEMETVKNENIVESSQANGETLVSDESLETDSGNLNTDVSVITEKLDAQAELLSLQAQAYDGSISTTYTTYFSGVVDKLGIEDYVLIRSGQYEYLFVYGDLELSGTTFRGSGTIMTINTYQNTTIGIETDDNITISVGSYMAYSNLGSYPALAVGPTKAQYYELLWLIIVIALTVYISGWFGYGLGGWRIWKKDILH